MSFERLSFQSWFEEHLGCKNLEEWDNFQADIEACTLEDNSLQTALSALDKDAASLLHKAILTFVGAYADLLAGHRSWAMVKLYYSLFYTLRSRLCARHHGMLRNKSWFHFDLNNKNCSGIKLPSKKYRNDHEAALQLYQDIFSKSDKLLSNNVDGKQPFSWMMDLRNIANYRLARFPDPDFLFKLPNNQDQIDAKSLETILVSTIMDSDLSKIFQAEYAWIGIPARQILATYDDLTARNQFVKLNVGQFQHTIASVASLPVCFSSRFDAEKVFISD